MDLNVVRGKYSNISEVNLCAFMYIKLSIEHRATMCDSRTQLNYKGEKLKIKAAKVDLASGSRKIVSDTNALVLIVFPSRVPVLSTSKLNHVH